MGRGRRRFRALAVGVPLAALALAALLAAAEWAARQRVFHVTRARPSGLAERLEASPALLIETSDRGRRYRAGADVRVHHHPLARGEVRIEVGPHGFRHPPLGPRAPGERRILVLGDSVTAADYLRREEIYTARLQALLAGLSGLEPGPVQVVNAGVGNVGIREEIALLEDRGLAIEPDVVLLAFYLNDAQPSWGAVFGGPAQPGIERYSVLLQALEQLRALRRLRDSPLVAWRAQAETLDWRASPEALRALAESAAADWGAAWHPGAWGAVDEGLARLRALAQAHGFRAAVLAFPVVYQVEAAFLERGPQAALAERAARLGLPFLDLLPVLRRDAGPAAFLDQCHLDARGHAVVAQALQEFLRREGLLGVAAAPAPPAPPGS